MKNITDEDLARAIREVAAEDPNYVYRRRGRGATSSAKRCNCPICSGCLIGTALHRLGVPLETLAQHESKPAHEVLDHVAPDVSSYMKLKATRVQRLQDLGATWRQAARRLD
ncbi:hypothetical protein [Streptomyces hoynatensis]|uniref:Uncharacterized protein n=1 Tax=Streptomyces hoynatensis TaxID=1141874 RepID=A0A3A9YG34_9ACTN|nr:hypothetical protein [Streptomyces hoynatensis]RKN35961.1 hypothetical protein D7294_30490 [Streptomyces hoynatensis]